MLRKIIKIDEEKCNGCGACANACHEGAIAMVKGKAKLMREDYCDGLGDCLPACPMGAISFVEREAKEYDAEAVRAAKSAKGGCSALGCPGSAFNSVGKAEVDAAKKSELAQWPCQIKLIPANAPCFSGAKLLVAADCTAYAYAAIHEDFMKGRITLIGCPKLDGVNYGDKFADIFENADVADVTVLRMEVPCCGGIEFAVKTAIEESGKNIPLNVVTVTIDGKIK